MKYDPLYSVMKFVGIVTIAIGISMMDVSDDTIIDIMGLFLILFGMLNVIDASIFLREVENEKRKEDKIPISEDES